LEAISLFFYAEFFPFFIMTLVFAGVGLWLNHSGIRTGHTQRLNIRTGVDILALVTKRNKMSIELN
jgi:hypothetical protein